METTMLLTTNDVAGLPIIPAYTPGELTQAHLQRVADENFIAVQEVSSHLKRFVADKYPSIEPHLVKQKLANLLGHPMDVVEKLRLTDYLVVPNNQASAKRVCPICLAEDMPAHLLLAEPAYGICHLHRVAHVYRCASCSRLLKWGQGSYFQCRCGFDLRHSPIICVDNESSALYLSCLLDQSLAAVDGIPKLQGHELEGARLRTAVAYLMQDKALQGDVDALQKEISPAVQSEALQWLAIGMRVGDDRTKLNDVVAGIEARHIWGPAQPEWMLSRSQHLMDSITWKPLRLLAGSAQMNAIEYRPDCDVESVIAPYDVETQTFLEQILRGEPRVSPILRNELLFAVRSQAEPQSNGRLNALVETTRDLRWIDDARWDLQIPISTKDEILSFIAAGVIHPSIPLAIDDWHVDQRDVAQAFQRVWQGQWPDVASISDDAYMLMFDQVFKSNIKPSNWLALPKEDIERRVIALLRGDSLSISGWRYSWSQLALPLGFCPFLSTQDCEIYCDPMKFQLDSFGLICPTWQKAAEALISACLRAQDNFRRLVGWQKLATEVAEQYQLGDPWDKSSARPRIKANSLIARFSPYPYKTLEEALRSESCPDAPRRVGLHHRPTLSS
jgi:hypothetical protein